MSIYRINKIKYSLININLREYKTWATILPFIDFDNKPKISPGRWGNVGSFVECDKKKSMREHWTSVITTQDHCGDVICGEEKSIIEAQGIIKKEK